MNLPAAPWVGEIITILVVVGFFLSALQMLRLLFGFLLAQQKVPTLLWRDATFFLSVMGVIAANYLWLLLGYTAPERPWWWTVISGIVLILAAWTYVFFGIRRFMLAHYDREQDLKNAALLDAIKEVHLTVKEVGKSVGDKADAAYHEANQVNLKISHLNERLLDEVAERKEGQ